MSGQLDLGFNHVATGRTSDEWLTPPELVAALGRFDLDPCAPVNRPWDTAAHHFTLADNGLTRPWHGRVWLNPPYGRSTFRWLARAASHGDAIALTFARTETVGFQREVWRKADAVLFLQGRIRFCRPDGSRAAPANAPSCLIAYGSANVAVLAAALDAGHLRGCMVRLAGRDRFSARPCL